MSEFRRDPIVGDWVIIAPERARRPQDYEQLALRTNGAACPFCEGNEQYTPPEIYAVRRSGSSPNGPGWLVRVVPNRFPALRVEHELTARPYAMFDLLGGVGAHEVIIETPEHVRSFASLPEQQIRQIVRVYHQRLVDLAQDTRLAQAVIFKNVGHAAGASLRHSHSQLIATPFVPPRLARELRGAEHYYRDRGRCVYCDIAYEEAQRDERVVVDLPQILAYCPYASRFPFEVWLQPKEHTSHFEDSGEVLLEELATALKIVLRKLDTVLEEPAFNFVLHSGPFRTGPLAHYHWHLEIMPRLSGVAGFELGSDVFINPVPPETAAAFLREAEIEVVANGIHHHRRNLPADALGLPRGPQHNS